MSEDILIVCGGHLHLRGQSPVMLPNSQQCTRLHPTTENNQAPDVRSAKGRKPCSRWKIYWSLCLSCFQVFCMFKMLHDSFGMKCLPLWEKYSQFNTCIRSGHPVTSLWVSYTTLEVHGSAIRATTRHSSPVNAKQRDDLLCPAWGRKWSLCGPSLHFLIIAL